MKALSLWQPWASFMFANLSAYPPKSVETRGSRVVGGHRGPVAIHATAKEPTWVRRLFTTDDAMSGLLLRFLRGNGAGNFYSADVFADLPRGCVLGSVDVLECVATDNVDRALLGDDEIALGDYAPGRFAIATYNAVRLCRPFPWKGRQGLWTLPDYAWEHAASAHGVRSPVGTPRWLALP